jgi:phosphate-selective porin OprO/OprP
MRFVLNLVRALVVPMILVRRAFGAATYSSLGGLHRCILFRFRFPLRLCLLLCFLPGMPKVVEGQSINEGSYRKENHGELNEIEPDTSTSLLGDMDNLGRLYHSPSNPLVQEVWVLGRYHGQYHWTDASTGDSDGFESRRFRLGGQAKLLSKLTLHGQAVSGRDMSPFYNGFTELWAQWSVLPEMAVTIGQQKNRFTHDRNVSSRYINYLERALVTNLFRVDYTLAVTLQGKIGAASYYTGLFSNATGQNMGKSFTQLNSGYSALTAVYYDLGAALDLDSLTLYGSYLHSEANDNATNMNYLRDGLSAAVIITDGYGSMVGEVTAGTDSKEGQVIGLNLQPAYFINTFMQVATRFQVATSSGSRGLQPQVRYEQEAGFQAGELYHALYLGMNLHLSKHRLKLMYGVEYAHMDGDEAWTASSMVRFYFGPHSGGAFPMNKILPHDTD